MYYVYLIVFKLMYVVRLRETSIRLARHLEQYCRQPLGISQLYNAIWDFTPNTHYPLCRGDDGCWFPVLSDNDPFHESCRAKEVAQAASEKAEEDAYYAQLEEQMDLHDTFCHACNNDKCVCYDIADEPDDCAIDDDEDEICEGDCGQPAYACTCAELASWRKYNATPMEERCGPWTA